MTNDTLDADASEPTYYWVIGVGLAILASFISNFGVNLQKLTHIRRNQGIAKAKVYSREPLWITGLLLVILGSFADFAALEFGAQSIITPLGSLTLVANVCIAPRLLGEQINTSDYFSTVVIMFGSMISVAFADHVDEQFTAEQIYSFFLATRFIILFISTLVVMLGMWLALQYCEHVAEQGEDSLEYQKLIKYHRFLYAALSGTVGAQNVLFAKCFVEILVDWFKGGPFLFASWQTWVILVCLGSTIFLQIRWMNAGLQKFDALFIVPVFQSFWIGVSVITGLVFFGEWAAMAPHERAGFPFGVLITVCGLFVLTRRQVNLQTKAEPDTPISNGTAHSNGTDHTNDGCFSREGGAPDSDEESFVVDMSVTNGVEVDMSVAGRMKHSNGHVRVNGDGSNGEYRQNGNGRHGGVFGPRIEDFGIEDGKDNGTSSSSGLRQFGKKISDFTHKLTRHNGDHHSNSNGIGNGTLHRRRSSTGGGGAESDDSMDTAFDVKLGLMGAGAPASIGGSAVFRTATVLKPERLMSKIRHPHPGGGFQRLETEEDDGSSDGDENTSSGRARSSSSHDVELASPSLASRMMNSLRRVGPSSQPRAHTRARARAPSKSPSEGGASYTHLSSASPDSRGHSSDLRSKKSAREVGDHMDDSAQNSPRRLEKNGMSENLLDDASDS